MVKMAVFAEKEAETLLGSFRPSLKQGGPGSSTRGATAAGARFALSHHSGDSQEKKSLVRLFPLSARLLVITGRDSPKFHPRALPGWESFC